MIFYFSGTGNTKWAAEALAKETGERLFFIPQEMKGDCNYNLKKGERIGFCFPVHGWQPPHIVRAFIKRMTITRHTETPFPYCFALVTCGDSIGKTMEILNHDLVSKQLTAVSVFSLIMPESYVCLPFMYTDTPEKESRKIANATDELKRYATMIVNRQANESHTTKGATPWLFSHVLGAYFNSKMITDKKFFVNTEACLRCGICQKVCPTDNITLSDGMPAWLHNDSCTCCLACYHHCPQHAINYGKRTKKRGQYYFGHKQKDA